MSELIILLCLLLRNFNNLIANILYIIIGHSQMHRKRNYMVTNVG